MKNICCSMACDAASLQPLADGAQAMRWSGGFRLCRPAIGCLILRSLGDNYEGSELSLYPMRRMLLYGVLLGLWALSCTKEVGPTSREVIVPTEVQPYVDRFLDAAAARGQAIDLTQMGLTVRFVDDIVDETAGLCQEEEVIISRQSWDLRNDAKREELIFHELGHCVLSRTHDNDLLPNDEWQSMMRGYPIPMGHTGPINYSGVRRAYYLDELFDPQTAIPDWAHALEAYDLPVDARDTVLHRVNVGASTPRMPLPDTGDFEIEVLIDIQNSQSAVGLAWGGADIQDEIVVHYTVDKTFTINAGIGEQSIIYQRHDFALLDDAVNRITVRKRGDIYQVYINETFVYWLDVRMPLVRLFRGLAAFVDPPNFREIGVYQLEPL